MLMASFQEMKDRHNAPPVPGLPPLTGVRGLTVDLIREGAVIREELLEDLANQIAKTDAPADLKEEMHELFREVALRQTNWGWWMAHDTYRSACDLVYFQMMTKEDKARHTALVKRPR
jgi:hypothetical protein